MMHLTMLLALAGWAVNVVLFIVIAVRESENGKRAGRLELLEEMIEEEKTVNIDRRQA